MKMLYSVGHALLSREQLAGTGKAKDVRLLLGGLHDRRRVGAIAALDDVPKTTKRRRPAGAIGAVAGFVDIGVGKPLSVEIREIYTGKYPRGVSLFGGKQSAMLMTTAMKGLEVSSGSARAVNFLTRKVKPHTRLRQVDATTVGTPLVYYSPALTQMEAVLTVDIAFDEFPKEAFDAVSTAASSAAGIPAFAAAGPYLVVAGTIVNLLGRLGESGFDSSPDFTATVALALDRPGEPLLAADYRLCMEEAGLQEIRADYQIDEGGSLVRCDNGELYDGDFPYVVLSIDGREHDERKTFVPMAATADMVKTFFGSKPMFSTSIETALEGMKLYSDWQFRERALTLDKQVKAETDTAKKDQLRALRDATLKNIGKDELKPAFAD